MGKERVEVLNKLLAKKCEQCQHKEECGKLSEFIVEYCFKFKKRESK